MFSIIFVLNLFLEAIRFPQMVKPEDGATQNFIDNTELQCGNHEPTFVRDQISISVLLAI